MISSWVGTHRQNRPGDKFFKLTKSKFWEHQFFSVVSLEQHMTLAKIILQCILKLQNQHLGESLWTTCRLWWERMLWKVYSDCTQSYCFELFRCFTLTWSSNFIDSFGNSHDNFQLWNLMYCNMVEISNKGD